MKKLSKKIFRFAIPSILSMWIFTLYTIVDGIFIGKYLGALALGATNIAMPIFNMSFGMGIMIAVGASTLISIAFSQKKKQEGNYYFNLASLVAFSIGLCLSFLCFLFLKPLVSFLGADETLFPYVYDYVQVILCFFPFYLCGYGWEIYIKVDGNAIYPMLCVLSGACINIILDYIFMGLFHTGVQGAALATGIAQSATTIFLFLYILKKSKYFVFEKYHFHISSIFHIIKTGFPEFFTEVSSGILIIIFNHFSFFYLGNQGIVYYSVISYLSSLIIMTMIGFAQGVQPILSFYFGLKAQKELKHIFKISVRTILVLSFFFCIFTCIFSQNLVKYFLHSPKDWYESALALRKYSFSYLFLGLNILFSAFFTAMKKAKYASLITFFRGIVFPLLLLKIFPFFMKESELWFVACFSEFLTFGITFFLFKKYQKESLHD